MIRRVLASKNQPAVLILMLALDLVVNLVAPKDMVEKHLDHLLVVPPLRPWLNPIKAAGTVGLVAGLRWRTIGALTSAAFVGYFVFALGYHRRVRDNVVVTAPAVLYGGVSVRALVAFLARSSRA